MSEDNNYPDEEYITNENDPYRVEKIDEDNSISITENEVKIEHEEIEASPKLMITNLSDYDYTMNEKVLDALRKGRLR